MPTAVLELGQPPSTSTSRGDTLCKVLIVHEGRAAFSRLLLMQRFTEGMLALAGVMGLEKVLVWFHGTRLICKRNKDACQT
jgi:hypothetical protein